MVKGILVQVGEEAFVVVELGSNRDIVSPRYRFEAEEAAADYDVQIVAHRLVCAACGCRTFTVDTPDGFPCNTEALCGSCYVTTTKGRGRRYS